MNIFKNLNIPLDTKIGIDGIFTACSNKGFSHNGGWTQAVVSQFSHLGYTNVTILDSKASWNDQDLIVLNHGVNHADGVFNLFGGANDELAERLNKFITFEGAIYSLYFDMPDLMDLYNSRKKSATQNFLDLDLEKMKTQMDRVVKIDKIFHSNKLILGDSHSISVYRPGFEISRNDGKTLHGFLKEGIKSYIHDDIDTLIFYAGNIDIRHHLKRQEDPESSIKDMIVKLEEQLKALNLKHIMLVQTLSIENESRKLPQTGYYKGTPFIGTWQERNSYRDLFNAELQDMATRNSFKVLSWPDFYTNSQGELMFDMMEAKQSVHLRPDYYVMDLKTGKTNTNYLSHIQEKPVKIKKVKDDKIKKEDLKTSSFQELMTESYGEPGTAERIEVDKRIAGVELELVAKSKEKKVKREKNQSISFDKENIFYQDALEYHKKASMLESIAHGNDGPKPDDALMCNVHIYDSVNRYCAGFSNLLEDFHFPNRQGKKRNERVNNLPLAENMYLYLVHRITGSGASFQPGTHGYCNSVLPHIWTMESIADMSKHINEYTNPMFTSKGNQPPMFTLTMPEQFKTPGREYLVHHAPQLIEYIYNWLHQQSSTGSRATIRSTVDHMNEFNKKRGFRKFNFSYTAFVNDVAEYYPNLVDPNSHTYYGNNCLKTLSVIGERPLSNNSKFLDYVMENLQQDIGYKPYDLEDSPCCDIVRYWNEFVPTGYKDIDKSLTKNNSLIKQRLGEEEYYRIFKNLTL